MPGAEMLILGWRLADRTFGVDVRSVAHIRERLAVRALPRPLPGISGLTFFRGRVFPVLDLARILLDEPDHRWPENPEHLILQTAPEATADEMYGAPVDALLRIFSVTTDDLTTWTDPPDHPAVPFVRALVTVEENTLWLVDMRRIVRHLRRGLRSRRVERELSTRQGA